MDLAIVLWKIVVINIAIDLCVPNWGPMRRPTTLCTRHHQTRKITIGIQGWIIGQDIRADQESCWAVQRVFGTDQHGQVNHIWPWSFVLAHQFGWAKLDSNQASGRVLVINHFSMGERGVRCCFQLLWPNQQSPYNSVTGIFHSPSSKMTSQKSQCILCSNPWDLTNA